MKKQILIITYHFPPSAEIGGLRAANFAKYLPACDWDPRVLTIEDRFIRTVDGERRKDVENVVIFKAGLLPTLRDAYLKMKKGYSRILRPAPPKPEGPDGNPDPDPAAREKLLQRWKRYFIALFMTLPDTERGWILPAAFRAIREIRRGNIDCILTTCPPYSVHIIGLLVKMATRVKWVADFRDPWMNGGMKIAPTCALSNRIESWLEKSVVKKADLVLFNVDRLRDVYKNTYTSRPAEKFVSIPNGIDRLTFSKIRSSKKYEKFTLSYTGSLYVDRSPEPVFKALGQLLGEKKIGPDSVRVKLVGHCRHIGRRPMGSLISEYGLRSVVEVLDPVPYMQALEIIRQSHVALLIAPNQPYQIPGKVYDYLGAGVKILAIAEPSATSDFINAAGCGGAFSPPDIGGIKEFIIQAMRSGTTTGEDYSAVISRYDAQRTAESLSDNLNKLVGKNSRERKGALT